MAPPVAGTICRAAAMARLGQAAAAFVLLDLTLQRSGGLAPPHRAVGAHRARRDRAHCPATRTRRARAAQGPGRCRRATRSRSAPWPTCSWTWAARPRRWHWSRTSRHTTASCCARRWPARRLDAPWWQEQAAILGERFAAATLRGDALHLREEARYRLALADDADGALRLATANWRAQREFWDARLVLESALAARDPKAAREVTAWLAATGLEDARLRPLLQRLGGEG